jgi:hypothetical protein
MAMPIAIMVGAAACIPVEPPPLQVAAGPVPPQVPISLARAEDLVGKRVPPLPDGMYQGGGACIGNGPGDSCRRSVSVFMSSKGKRIGVYAAVSDGRDEKGFAFWIVTDVLPYPNVDKGHDLVWGSCRYDGVEDNSVVAVVRNSKQPWLRAAGWAYRVEDTSGRFIKLDTMHVDCANTALEAD